MKIYNTLDDKNRFVRFKATTELGAAENTHTYSYLYTRNMFKEMGDVMGLEQKVMYISRREDLKE